MKSLLISLLLFVTVPGLSQGAEWRTSGSKHCIERCHTGTRKGLDSVLWCKAVDGVAKEHKPSESGRPSAHEDDEVEEEDRYLWDYCTPATVDTIEGGEIFDEGVEAVVVPERVDRRKRQIGGSGGNFNPGTVGQKAASSLAGVNCEGECKENFGGKYKCDVANGPPNNFFCSPEVPLARQQLSSHNKLWCISECVKGSSADYYECRTLYGYDRCSPQGDRSSTGSVCESPCQANMRSEKHHYQCITNTTTGYLEDCGYWYLSGAEKEALQYTQDDKVCAGPCQEVDNELVCSYVDWVWNENTNVGELEMKLGECGPDNKSSWTTVGIVIGCIVGALLLIGIVAFIVSRKKYSQAATNDY